ncbi:MAG: ATP-dependent RNA helicase RhlE [Candidatus Azotimanducaceae bacterium]|jgi:ATP-dependent RNA helicase RhlE
MSFESLGLSNKVQRALIDAGYTAPTIVQNKSIPLALKGRDLLVAAQTGTGKTAAFIGPMLDLLGDAPPPASNFTKGLILVPTRELAMQVHQSVKDYGCHSGLRSAVVFGGVKINPQMMGLRRGVHLLVATPGRLLDLYEQNAVRFEELEMLVLDEADRMLGLGFSDEMNRILKILPTRRQTLMFSATLSIEVKKLAGKMLNKPVEISVNPERVAAVKVEQWLVPVDKKRKKELLTHLISDSEGSQALVFVNTKQGADHLVKGINSSGHTASAIHGDKSQSVRLRNLQTFKNGEVQILVATDVASRGLDIGQLPMVINFELPKVPEDYVHRIGRTGRAAELGKAISLVCADEFEFLRNIERLLRQVVPREDVDGFVPDHKVPESQGVPPPAKPKKPKKLKGSQTPPKTNSV